MSDKIIMMDSPEAASYQTVSGWVSSRGYFFGGNENAARYDGCTHIECKSCGAPTKKGRLLCESCQEIEEIKRYNEMPKKQWDGKALLYSQTLDQFLHNMDDARDESYEHDCTIADLRLVICEPVYIQPLDYDYFADDSPDLVDAPDWAAEIIDAFNESIKNTPELSWRPSKFALELNENE